MFKINIKKKSLDRFSAPGSYIGVLFHMGTPNEENYIQWKMLFYDHKTDQYTRSKASMDGHTNNIPYTVIFTSHRDIQRYVKEGTWKLKSSPDV